MVEFDPAKDAIDLAKHGVSLARWVEMAILAIEPFDYGDPRYRGYGLIDGVAYCWCSRSVTGDIGR